MVLEIWFDFMCPQSYLLHQSLLEAKQAWQGTLDIKYRSYEMLPGLKTGEETSLFDVISKHLIIDREEVETYFSNHPNILDLNPCDVHDAHRMLHLARQYEKDFDWVTQLLHDFYKSHKDIGSKTYLKETALALGLPIKEIDEVLSSDMYKNRVDSNRENAILKGIHRIPHMRIDGKHPMQGWQTKEQLLIAFTHAKKTLRTHDVCEGEECEV